MRISTSMRWLVVVAGAAMLLAVVAACAGETVEVPGETVVVKEEVIKEVQVPGETVVVEKEVIKEVMVPGETVTKEVVKEVMVPGETVVVEKEVVKTVEVPGETVVVEKVMVKEVPGKKYVTDPTTGKVVSAPEYGGTFTFVGAPGLFASADPYYGGVQIVLLDLEQLGIGNWGLDRDVYDFKAANFLPVYSMTGNLAESWESPDDTTYVFKIRQGVYWHDEPPVNGRELNAYDIEWHFSRMLGMGEFSEAEPTSTMFQSLTGMPIESVTAPDKWTVVFKLSRPNLQALRIILFDGAGSITPREVIEQYGDVNDWRNMVGTGPMMLTDLVEDSSMTWTKNPNYWGFDEKYPENRLPYVDEVRKLIMADVATRNAALRTGKADIMPYLGALEQIQSLEKTNPEIVIHEIQFRNNNSFAMNTRLAPFDDVRVRKAMQMALDVKTINQTFFKGYGITTPGGRAGTPGYIVPFEEWPEEIKKGYIYDPEGAEALLDAAGLPRGADGIRFTTGADQEAAAGPSTWEPIAFEYWRAIGVEVEPQMLDEAAGAGRIIGCTYEGFTSWAEGFMMAYDPVYALSRYTSDQGWNTPCVQDPVYDAMYATITAATTIEEQMRLSREADMKVIEQHWQVYGPMMPIWVAAQPWVIGYNGELNIGGSQAVYARLWIDQELKKQMGR